MAAQPGAAAPLQGNDGLVIPRSSCLAHQARARAVAAEVLGAQVGPHSGLGCINALKQEGETVSEAILDIKPWGNNLGVRLPAAVAREARLSANQRVRITVEDGRVIITPYGERPLSLADRLALFDPALHGGEAMPAVPVGQEAW